MFSQLRRKVEVENALLSKLIERQTAVDTDGDNSGPPSATTDAILAGKCETASLGKARSDSGLDYAFKDSLRERHRRRGTDTESEVPASMSSSTSSELEWKNRKTFGSAVKSVRPALTSGVGSGAECETEPPVPAQPLRRSVSVPEEVRGDDEDSENDRRLLAIIGKLVHQIEEMGGKPQGVAGTDWTHGDDQRSEQGSSQQDGLSVEVATTIAELQQENAVLRQRLSEAESYYDASDMRSEEQIAELTNQMSDMHAVLVERERQMHLADSRAEDSAKELDQLSAKVRTLEASVSRQKDVIEQLRDDIDRQKDRLREVAKERDELLLRNASLTRELEWVRREGGHEREHILEEIEQLSGQLEHYKMRLQQTEEKDQGATTVDPLKSKIAQLEDTLRDREATIRLQQFRLNDLKKTLQKEFRLVDADAGFASRSVVPSKEVDRDSATFQYLRNVLLRFVTSTDYEATQLIRAVATLLELTQDEEKLIWDTLQWKMSWLPYSKPKGVFNRM